MASSAHVSAGGGTAVAPQRRRRPRRWAVAGVAAAVTGYLLVDVATGSSGSAEPAPEAIATGTAAVEKRTLAQRLTLDGALTYVGDAQLVAGRAGTITELPQAGATVRVGQVLWRVDDVPVPLLAGRLPQWRRLVAGMSDGPDVEQLEENLTRLGHAPAGGMTVDEKFTSATAAAVKRWQKSLGHSQTGFVEPGAVVFYPSDVRVTEQLAALGAQAAPGSPVLKVSQTRRVVTVKLDARRQEFVKVGAEVDVVLPDDRTVRAKVSRIGTVASQEAEGTPTVDVTVDFAADAKVPTLDQAPVDVLVDVQSRTGLAVPVKALLALSEGGYAVETAADGQRRLVPVETGMFADGYVEISGQDVREGMTVTVPR